MSIKEMSKVLGRSGDIREGELWFTVKVTDVKQAYGNVRYQVTPEAGTGLTWVNADRVQMKGDKQ